MISHKQVNNGAVREENELCFTITRDFAAEHYWETHRLTEVISLSLSFYLSLSHNLVINGISLLSTAQASVTVTVPYTGRLYLLQYITIKS